jgi:branched-chain amino acid aminotransferase
MVDGALREARAAGVREASVRLTVTRGVSAAPGLAPPAEATPTIVLAVHALPVFPRSIYEAGLSARTARARHNEWAATAGVKTLAYPEAIIALAHARAAGADEALVLDTAGHLAEATASNLFLCIDDALVTPPCTCGALPGITREAVLELAPALGLAATERAIEPGELGTASEAFLTSSLREIAPLVRVDERAVGSGRVGPVTRRVMEAFAALVRRECAP